MNGMIVPVVVWQHAEDTVALGNTRSGLARAPRVKLHHLRRLDDRLAAHLDGLVVAGDAAAALTMSALESPGSGEAFMATVAAMVRRFSDGVVAALAAPRRRCSWIRCER